jgi:hypothetical protein
MKGRILSSAAIWFSTSVYNASRFPLHVGPEKSQLAGFSQAQLEEGSALGDGASLPANRLPICGTEEPTRKSPAPNWGRKRLYTGSLSRAAGIILITALFLTRGGWSQAATPLPYLGAVSFKVLNVDGTEVIGQSRYELVSSGDNRLIGHGQAHFNDGEHDVEYDTLEIRANRIPTMRTLDHKFYNAGGSMQREIAADFRTGQASCTRYQDGELHSDKAKLDFTPDSYGGSAVILPLEQYLAQGGTAPLTMKALNCVPAPQLIAVVADVQKPSRWSHYPGQTVEVDIKPDLGWLNAVLAPFLPELRAWFVPSNDWAFVGGEFARYFRGPRIILVREIPTELRNAETQKETGD